MEGYIFRTIQKIEKYIDSLKYLYLLNKRENIVNKLEASTKLLKRDVVNVKSLYLS